MLTTWHPLSEEVGTNFADKLRSLGRCSSFSGSGHGAFLASYTFCTFRVLQCYVLVDSDATLKELHVTVILLKIPNNGEKFETKWKWGGGIL
jgi:hypothetical protein